MIEDGDSKIQAFHRNLLLSKEAMAFLNSRGMTLDAISKFAIGWFDIVRASKYHRRILFPVRDQNGVLHTFQGRAIDDDNTPKFWHASYDKSKIVYGLYENARAMVGVNRTVLVEGPMDVTALWQSSIPAVASFGTAFTFAQACLLRRFVDNVVIWYDPDEAGEAASIKVFDLLEEAGIRRAYFVSSEYDAAETYRRGGAKAIHDVLASAQ